MSTVPRTLEKNLNFSQKAVERLPWGVPEGIRIDEEAAQVKVKPSGEVFADRSSDILVLVAQVDPHRPVYWVFFRAAFIFIITSTRC